MSETGVKGFKVFNPDWTCTPNGEKFQYAVGGIYEEDINHEVISYLLQKVENRIEETDIESFDIDHYIKSSAKAENERRIDSNA